MLDGRVILVQQAYYDDLREQAHRAQQRRQAAVVAWRPLRWALAWLGRRLVVWGVGLQRRYGERADVAGLHGVSAPA